MISRNLTAALSLSLLIATPAFAADETLPNLNAASAASGTDLVPTTQGGNLLKQTLSALATYFWNSPTLVTPTLGVATATSIDGLTITTSTGTLTIANGKTLTVNNTVTIGTLTSGDYCTYTASGTVLNCNTAAPSPVFSTITSGTNTTAAMVVGSGATLGVTGSGTVTATAAPLSGITGFGTGVASALADNVGSAGAPVVYNGALGTPSSGTGTNITGLPISTGVSGLGTGVATALADAVNTSGGAITSVPLGTCFTITQGSANASPLVGGSTLYGQQFVNTYTGDHAVSASESCGLDVMNSASPHTFTLAQAGTTGFLSGTTYSFLNIAAGAATITTSTSTFLGVPLTSSNIVLAQYGFATCTSDGTNWNCQGAPSTTAALDLLGSTQGDVLYRDSGAWKVLGPGTSGYYLKTGGAAANPSWAAISATGCAPSGSAGDVLTDSGSGACNSPTDFTFSAGTITLGTNTSELGAVKMFGSTSGSVTIEPPAIAGTSTVLTTPAATDTLVGRATTDTLTNKSIAATEINSGTLPNAQAAIPTTAIGTSVTFSAPSGMEVCSSTCTITVPVPAAGYQFCAWNGNNVSTVITFAAIGSSAFYQNTARTAYGTAGTGTLTSGGATGDLMCIVGVDATHYQSVSFSGTWTAS